MGEEDNKVTRKLKPWNFPDADDCRRCHGSGFVMEQVENEPGVYDVNHCPNGCKPENPIVRIRVQIPICPWVKVFEVFGPDHF